MTLMVFLSSTLRKFRPDYDSSAGISLKLSSPVSVAQLCHQLEIPLEKVKIVMVNGVSAPFDEMLHGNERVSLFPPVGGG